MANMKPGTRQYYDYQKACAEAAVDRQLDEVYKRRLAELRAEARKEGVYWEQEFTTWLDQPGMGGVTHEEVTVVADPETSERLLTLRKSVSRRQALNLELRRLKADLMAREGFDADPFL